MRQGFERGGTGGVCRAKVQCRRSESPPTGYGSHNGCTVGSYILSRRASSVSWMTNMCQLVVQRAVRSEYVLHNTSYTFTQLREHSRLRISLASLCTQLSTDGHTRVQTPVWLMSVSTFAQHRWSNSRSGGNQVSRHSTDCHASMLCHSKVWLSWFGAGFRSCKYWQWFIFKGVCRGTGVFALGMHTQTFNLDWVLVAKATHASRWLISLLTTTWTSPLGFDSLSHSACATALAYWRPL